MSDWTDRVARGVSRTCFDREELKLADKVMADGPGGTGPVQAPGLIMWSLGQLASLWPSWFEGKEL
ncbi:hypothetical protein Droror1_Dr00023821, partial [Drosera rotundifolia]